MAVRAYYGEELYFNDDAVSLTQALQENIRVLLSQNHGVGILGGRYAAGLPIHLCSKLALDMLGFASLDEFEAFSGGCLLPLLCTETDAMTEKDFSQLPATAEVCMRTSSGQHLWVRIVRWEAAEADGTWLLSLCDIDTTHRRELQLIEAKEEADHANRAKTLFLSRMSHDIRTPINGILGMARIAGENLDSRDKVADALEKISAAGQQLQLLVDEVLDVSQLESGHIELLHTPFDLRRELQKMYDMIALLAAEADIRLQPLQLDIRHTAVVGSAIHLHRILENLLTNAVKYTPAGGSVVFAVRELESNELYTRYRFTVRDTGYGMSEAFQAHMYEQFRREEVPGRNIKGTGLGLPIARDLVLLMDGTIEAESKLGEGTCFTVCLPLERSMEPANEEQQDELPERYLAGAHVLLAEDNALNREIAVYLLTHAGAEVCTAENGKQAVEAYLQDDGFDLILMDIMMPEMDGLQAMRTIRSCGQPHAKEVPIIAMTANAFAADINAALDAGANAHLAKPIDVEALRRTLYTYLNHRH